MHKKRRINCQCGVAISPAPVSRILRGNHRAGDKLFNSIPLFLSSLFPVLPMSGQFLCVLPVNNFVYYFVSFIFLFFATLCGNFWAKMRLCGRVTVVNEEEADCRMVIFSTQDSKHIQSEEKRSHRNEKHFVLGMEMENDNGAMETCHSFIT